MYSLWLYISYYIRPFIKWFLRKTTGLCELQRICYGEEHGASRIKGVEESLGLSKSPQIKLLVNHLNDISDNKRFAGANERDILQGATRTVLLVKQINPQVHVQFVRSFSRCIEQIWGYRQLIAEVETLRTVSYDSDNIEHEQKLLELWEHLNPNDPLNMRISKRWQEIGFQGDDPKTDFRGMGLLGLENLLYFAKEFKGPATHVLSHSHHPNYGYEFAITFKVNKPSDA
ncbi:hypothetical protein RN001_005272 [Aquatica leii]|uniref:ELMO domain-containing protein n=1 Tax=Aquatica leii TaxID=1421715 RepID=A0AAN7SPT5_9COLE|nr:hypothetical protein RN001_005272 [Aquatica leii]